MNTVTQQYEIGDVLTCVQNLSTYAGSFTVGRKYTLNKSIDPSYRGYLISDTGQDFYVVILDTTSRSFRDFALWSDVRNQPASAALMAGLGTGDDLKYVTQDNKPPPQQAMTKCDCDWREVLMHGCKKHL